MIKKIIAETQCTQGDDDENETLSQQQQQQQHRMLTDVSSGVETEGNINNNNNSAELWAELKFTGTREGRSFHAVCLLNNTIYSYGGYEAEKGISDKFLALSLDRSVPFELKTVQISTGSSSLTPGPRRRHSLSSFEKSVFLLGGQISTAQNTNSLWKYDTQSQSWENLKTLGDSFPCTDSHSSTLADSILYVFGGYTSEYTNAVYALDLRTLTWQTLSEKTSIVNTNQRAPCRRSSAGIALLNRTLYVFGGANSETRFNDLWGFSLDTLSWSPIVPAIGDTILPEQRSGHAMVCYKDWLFVFGGLQEITKERNDIYAYNPKRNHWENIQANSNQLNAPVLRKIANKNISSNHPTGMAKHMSVFRERINTKPSSISSSKQNYNNKEDNAASIQKIKQQQQQQSTVKKPREPTTLNKLMQEMGNNSMLGGSATTTAGTLKKKHFQHYKAKFLGDLDVPMKLQQQENIRDCSPTTEKLRNALEVIGSQNQNIPGIDAKQGKPIGAAEHSNNEGAKLLAGKKPCARDGHAACLVDNQLFVYGGDRHLMSFNDMYFFNLDAAMQRLEQEEESSQNQCNNVKQI